MRTDAESLGFLALTPEALHEVLMAIACMTDDRGLLVYWQPKELIVWSDLKDLARELLGYQHEWHLGYIDPETDEWLPPSNNVVRNPLSIVVDETRLPENAAWAVMAVNGNSRLYFVNTDKGVMEARAEYVA